MNTLLKTSITISLGAFVLLLSAYLNGFPIVYSDTSTYLASGFELETPFDRPITYGLFLWLSSLGGVSMWFVIFMQGLIVSFLLFNLLKISLSNTNHIQLIHLGTIGFLSFLSSVSWTTSQLIADIFTPIALLSLVLLTVGEFSKWKQGLLYFLFLLATAMHMSHITLNLLLIAAIFLLRYVNILGTKNAIKVTPLLVCVGLSLMSILTMGSAISKSKHGFLMGALVEHGIAKQYLDEHCPDADYTFCAYKDSLPDKGWIFLWNEDSPFYKMGGWKGTKEEFNQIIFNTLTEPTYLLLHVQESLKATADQLTKFELGDGNGVFLSGTLLYERVDLYFHHERPTYESSLQNTKKLTFLGWYNTLTYAIVLISILGLALVLAQASRLNKRTLSVIWIIILGVATNAWACGTLANAIDRLGSKVIWLIPLLAVIGLLNLWNKISLPTKPGH